MVRRLALYIAYAVLGALFGLAFLHAVSNPHQTVLESPAVKAWPSSGLMTARALAAQLTTGKRPSMG